VLWYATGGIAWGLTETDNLVSCVGCAANPWSQGTSKTVSQVGLIGGGGVEWLISQFIVVRGEYLARIGDCISCHTARGGQPFTRRMNPDLLYARARRWVDFMWPLAGLLRRLPKGYAINWRLLVADYSFLGLKGQMLKEWSYLDTFDMLSAAVNWVEKNTAPDSVTATGRAFPGRSRPLCPFPTHAQYNGSGDPESAANYSCRP
jgi:hypothetical protein